MRTLAILALAVSFVTSVGLWVVLERRGESVEQRLRRDLEERAAEQRLAQDAQASAERGERERLAEEIARLGARIEALSSQVEATARSRDGDSRETTAANVAAPSGEAAPSATDPAAEVSEALEVLDDPAASRDAREKAWRKVAQRNGLDRAISHFQERSRREPSNADVHATLGTAYVQKLQTVSDLEKGQLAARADRAFDDALKLDPLHWDARFTKAAALSFWPPLFGKQPEAVAQFEILRAQQEEQAPAPHHAQTYLFLGNLYLGQGNTAKARDAWSRGAELFPAHAELAAKAAEEQSP